MLPLQPSSCLGGGGGYYFQIVSMCPPGSTALMTTRQQEEHGDVRRGVLESDGAAWGHTICLVACQSVSGPQPSHTCHRSKIPPKRKTAVPRYIRSLLSMWCKSTWMSCGSWVLSWSAAQREKTHSITLIPQLRSQVGHVLYLPENCQLTTEKATSWYALWLSPNMWEQGEH